MSARYSPSPELRLRIGESRLRRRLVALLLLCQLVSLACLYRAGHCYPALLSAAGILPVLPRLLRDTARGTQLRWRRGEWALARGGALSPVELLPATRALPWGIHLAWRDPATGRRASCWLFADSLAPAELGRLRCRLALQR